MTTLTVGLDGQTVFTKDLGALTPPPSNGDPPVIIPTPPIDTTPSDHPDPPSTVSGGFFHPGNENDLKAQAQDACTNGKLLILDPNTRVDLHDTINLAIKDVGGAPHGIDFNGAQISWRVSDPAKHMFHVDLNGNQNRQFNFNNGYFYGGGYEGLQCASAVKFTTTSGSIYLTKVRNLVCEFAGVGVDVEGNMFEFLLDTPDIKDCRDALVRMANGNGVLSNAIIRTPFFHSSNTGPAIDLVGNCNSVIVTGGGSMIDCHMGAIRAPSGIKYVGGGLDMENCFDPDHDYAAIWLGGNFFGTTIDGISAENTAGSVKWAVSAKGLVQGQNMVIQNVITYKCGGVLT